MTPGPFPSSGNLFIPLSSEYQIITVRRGERNEKKTRDLPLLTAAGVSGGMTI